MNRRAMTLVELVLAAAVAGLLATGVTVRVGEGETAVAVAQARTDMRAIGAALEAYRAEYPRYPLDSIYYSVFGAGGGHLPAPVPLLRCLTTPVAYIETLPMDSFPTSGPFGMPLSIRPFGYSGEDWIKVQNAFSGASVPRIDPDQWVLVSVGPDQVSNSGADALYGEDYLNRRRGTPSWGVGDGCLYDPTNGTLSAGDLVQLGRELNTGVIGWGRYR